MSRRKKGPETPDGYIGEIDVSSLGGPSAPQVNLLPPEVRVRQSMGAVRLRAALVVVGVIAILGVVITTTNISLADAEDEVLAKEARVHELQLEVAKYQEVPIVKGRLEQTLDAREFAMSGEFLWEQYLRAINAVAPDDWTLTELSVILPTPMDDPQTSANPLAAPSVATINFTGKALTLPDVAAWLEGMASVPGFSDPYFSAAEVADEDGTTIYETTATVEITADALVSRFPAVEEDETEGTDQSDEEGGA